MRSLPLQRVAATDPPCQSITTQNLLFPLPLYPTPYILLYKAQPGIWCWSSLGPCTVVINITDYSIIFT